MGNYMEKYRKKYREKHIKNCFYMKKSYYMTIVILVLALFSLSGCQRNKQRPAQKGVALYLDVRGYSEEMTARMSEAPIYNLKSLFVTKEALLSFRYNEKTIFPEGDHLDSDISPEELLELAKNPGLGIRSIHEQGYTGEGVTVAVIDQNLFLDHPEFDGKILAYRDFGCEMDKFGSMHAPAVASLLVGETIGTAPGAKLYFAAVPTWKGDATFSAEAMDWIVEENEKLPEGEKIRLVSVSAGFGNGEFTNAEAWIKSRERAEAAGILVLDGDWGHSMFSAAYFDTSGDLSRESVECLIPGQPNLPWEKRGSELRPGYEDDKLFVPISPRTVAEQYLAEDSSYQYCGYSGISWGIPYGAGVLAMGWQIAPEKTGKEMAALLLETAYERDGMKFIYPEAFIEALLAEQP